MLEAGTPTRTQNEALHFAESVSSHLVVFTLLSFIFMINEDHYLVRLGNR